MEVNDTEFAAVATEYKAAHDAVAAARARAQAARASAQAARTQADVALNEYNTTLRATRAGGAQGVGSDVALSLAGPVAAANAAEKKAEEAEEAADDYKNNVEVADRAYLGAIRGADDAATAKAINDYTVKLAEVAREYQDDMDSFDD